MASWHGLLAPLPAEAVVKRKPIVAPDKANDPIFAAIAGWEDLTVELSAGADGLRHLMVVLDATGQPISAGDHVMICRPVPGDDVARTEYTHDSIGGRLEADGTFNGTRWHMVRVLAEDEEDTQEAAVAGSQSSRPTDEEIVLLKELVAEIIRRAPK